MCVLLGWVLVSPTFGIEIQADITGFDDLETGVVEAAIKWWEMSLPGTGVFQVSITKAPLPGSTTGRTGGFMADAGGTPTSANITIDNDGAGHGWFVDETPHEEEEYDPGPNGTFVAKSGSAAEGKQDMLSTLKHEIGHAIGFTRVYGSFGGNITDPGGGAPRTYTGDDCIWTLTPARRGTHFCRDEHPGRLMNTGRKSGTRNLQSKDEIKILADAFGYNAVYPAVQPQDIIKLENRQATEYVAPGWRTLPASAIDAEIILLEEGQDSAVDTDWIRLFLAEGAVHWMRMTRPVGDPQIVESGSSVKAVQSFQKLWQTLEGLDVWSMGEGRPGEGVEGAATFTYTFTDPDQTHAFSGYAIDLIDDSRYYEIYRLVEDFYSTLNLIEQRRGEGWKP